MAEKGTPTKENLLTVPAYHNGGHRHSYTPTVTHSTLLSAADVVYNKSRRRSTIHTYTLSNYHTLPQDVATLRTVHDMTHGKAVKNVVVLGVAFMFVHTAFVSLQGLQSTMNSEGGVGVASLSCIYGTTVISCLMAPWLINKLTTKWTMIIAFILFTGYFAGNFYPKHFMLIPLGVVLGLVAGPLWSAQATFVTTVALTYAQHSGIEDQDAVINKFMGIFCGIYRTSYIWGNLITTLVLSNNRTLNIPTTIPVNLSFPMEKVCGTADCTLESDGSGETEMYNVFGNSLVMDITDSTKYMLLSIYLGCGAMGAIVLLVLLDNNVGKRKQSDDEDFSLSSKELFLSTLKMVKDSRCQLLILLVVFVGLEQGFMFGDFTKVNTWGSSRDFMFGELTVGNFTSSYRRARF
jgi:hypothetical protein